LQILENNGYTSIADTQGRIQDFKLGGAHLKKLRRAEVGANIFGVFRVKNHDFTPIFFIFSNFRGGAPPWIRPWILEDSGKYWLYHRRSWHGLTTPLFFNFLFTNLFSIKFLYFFIISSLFPYFNLFVSIFIQSYANNNLHVLTLYIDTNNEYLYRVNTYKLLLA
jgi:hypothetical protein